MKKNILLSQEWLLNFQIYQWASIALEEPRLKIFVFLAECECADSLSLKLCSLFIKYYIKAWILEKAAIISLWTQE